MQEIAIKELKENFIKDISDEWMLISAGNEEKYNMMTASWGFMGEIWGEDSVVIFIRPQRYTLEFVEKYDTFSLSFYGTDKQIHKLCGHTSGRDVDKMKESGLTPEFVCGAPCFKEARLNIVCKKMYSDRIKPENFIDKSKDTKWYPDSDHHIVFIAKIEKAFLG